MKTTIRGNQAETAVAQELVRQAYKILAQNWKTSRCEIDLIAAKSGVIYFIEVKFRSSITQGEGLDYITPKKQKQLNFAARVWCQFNNWDGDYRLLAASVAANGHNYLVQEIIELG